VPNNPVFAPEARKMESIKDVVVVFPLVPVTPVSVSAVAGRPKKFEAAIASAFRASATRTQAISTGQSAGAGDSVAMALAPRETASRANNVPSVATPLIATNSAPGCTFLESCVTCRIGISATVACERNSTPSNKDLRLAPLECLCSATVCLSASSLRLPAIRSSSAVIPNPLLMGFQ
jgi:hypothetical protein